MPNAGAQSNHQHRDQGRSRLSRRWLYLCFSRPAPPPADKDPVSAPISAPVQTAIPADRPILDPGWLFLIAGLGVLGATLLVPAADDLDEARWKRDVALVYEQHRDERLKRYDGYLAALDRAEPQLVTALAASQLGQMPDDRGLITARHDSRLRNVSVFPALEPPPMQLPAPRQPVDSLLTRLALGGSSRLWLIALGAVCVLIGMLPGTRK